MADKKKQFNLPPYSEEAEKALLGCLLINPDAVHRTLHILTVKSFYQTSMSLWEK